MDAPLTRNQLIKKVENKADILSWDAEEFKHNPKSLWWYVGFTIVSAGLILYAWYSRSVLTMILFVIMVIVAFIFARKTPKQLNHQLTPSGIIVGDMVYPYKNIKKFWIIYEPPYTKTLNLETTTYIGREVAIQLGRQNPVEVKMFLKKYLLEDLEKEESLTDIIARKLKF
ncbi:MAG: hypothetical protein ACM3KM_01400 [Acidobacteriaceae bacterium]